MALTHTVTLTLTATGTQLDVWDRYTIVQDMLSPGSPFTFTLFRSRVARSTWDVLQNEVRAFARVTLSIDGALQMNGRIKKVWPFRDPSRGAGIVISGNDPSDALQRFHASPRVSTRNIALVDFIANVCQPFDLDTIGGVEAADVRAVQLGERRSTRGARRASRRHQIDLTHPKIGESAWSVIARECEKAGFRVWVAPTVDDRLALVIDNPVSSGQPVFQFKYGENADGSATADTNTLSSGLQINVEDMPTEVYMYGRAARGDGTPARSCAHLEGVFDKRWVIANPPEQPWHLRAEHARNPDQTRAEGMRKVKEAAANHKLWTAAVQGHAQTSGGRSRIYAINTPCHVRDDVADLDEDMVITRVQFDGAADAENGTRTEIRCHPYGALNLTPEVT